MRATDSLFESRRADLQRRLESSSMPAAALLGSMRVLDEASRHTGQYQDPRYLPFYYHFGRVFAPRRVFFVGLDIGLHLGCMLKGCPNPELAVCLQPVSESFYSPRIAISNARAAAGGRFPVSVHVGSIEEIGPSLHESQPFDAAAVTAEMQSDSLINAMELCWSRLSASGTMLVDRLSRRGSREVFEDFCKVKGASAAVFETRYGCGIVSR